MTSTFSVRQPVDFIALAPIVLGFYPNDSLVMMTFGGPGFHARIDLPEDSDIQECIEALVEPAVRHHVKQVALVVFGERDYPTLQTLLVDRFMTAGINVVAALEARDDQYRHFGSSTWTDFDLASHPFTLDAQFQEVAPRHMSREALVQSIQPQGHGWTPEVLVAVDTLLSGGLETAMSTASQAGAKEAVRLWSEALRGADTDSEPVLHIALMLSLSAWLAGDGALSWAALDLADSRSPIHRMLSETLHNAVPPSSWPVRS